MNIEDARIAKDLLYHPGWLVLENWAKEQKDNNLEMAMLTEPVNHESQMRRDYLMTVSKVQHTILKEFKQEIEDLTT